MAAKSEIAKLKAKLRDAERNIHLSNPKDSIPKDIQKLSPSTPKDALKIKYFPDMDDAVRENFKKFRKDTYLELDLQLDLKKSDLIGKGQECAKKWHKILKKYIDHPAENESELEAKAVVDALKSEFEGIEFFKAEFPLYGYMTDKESSQVSFWNGFANAIGWYENRYVIVCWKAVKNLNIWEEDPHAHGKYFHQCLVYARLLQLHLQLHELPYILIVAISNETGKDIHPALFRDIPEECKDALEKFKWSKPELGATTVGAPLDALHLKFSKLELVD